MLKHFCTALSHEGDTARAENSPSIQGCAFPPIVVANIYFYHSPSPIFNCLSSVTELWCFYFGDSGRKNSLSEP